MYRGRDLFPDPYLATCHTIVVLLVCAFPTVVCPKIARRVAAYRLFEHFEEGSCYFVFRKVARGPGYKPERASVMSAAGTLHIYIEHGVVHFLHYALSAGEYRRVVIEKVEPQMYVLPFGHLIGYVSEE